MTKSRFRNFTAALLAGVVAALAGPAHVLAADTDDTEIFFNPLLEDTNDPAKKPRVLFVLDTSGSMNFTVPASGKTRLQELKDAMIGTLQGGVRVGGILNDPAVFEGIQAGLMQFTGAHNQQNITYPITDLTADNSTVEGGAPGKKVRDRLIELIDGFIAAGGTPTVPALFEAGNYMRGVNADLGTTSAANNCFFVGGTPTCPPPTNTNVNSLGNLDVSHPKSQIGGTPIDAPAGQFAAATAGQTCSFNRSPPTSSGRACACDPTTGFGCDRYSGTPVYQSPLTQDRGQIVTQDELDCRKADYIVFLTDGEPTYNPNSVITKIQTLTGVAQCAANPGDLGTATAECLSGSGNPALNERCGRCGIELASYLHNNDLRPTVPGNQWVIVHTIGFNLANANAIQFLQNIATAGGGNFYSASVAADLANVFKQILEAAVEGGRSFARPSLAVNAFNPLVSRNEVYVTMFEPFERNRWKGNVKKYRFCDQAQCDCDGITNGCTLGTILDANNNTIKDPVTGDFRVNAKNLWTSEPDGQGGNIDFGGALAKLTNDINGGTARNIYTYTGDAGVAGYFDAYTDGRTPLNGTSTLNSGANAVSTANNVAVLQPGMFGAAITTQAQRDALINWIRKAPDFPDSDADGNVTEPIPDTADADSDGNLAELLFPFEDPLHATTVAVEYGGSATAPVTKVFVPTNGGSLRMLNGATGQEEWAFIPQELLPLQETLRTNATVAVGNRNYGLDATPTVIVKDSDFDGLIDAGGDFSDENTSNDNDDFVALFLGQRDGGRRYFALEANPATTLGAGTAQNETGTVQPTLLWKIEGGLLPDGVTEISRGPGANPGYKDLGNTWSPPVPITINDNGVRKTALIFGGGNNPDLNDKFPTSQGKDTLGNPITGNIVYIVDATTGARIAAIGGTDTNADKTHADMDYPIPSRITAFDSDGDGAVDRLYFGDLGAQVWRVDLPANPKNALIGKLAVLSDPVAAGTNNTLAPIPLVPALPGVPDPGARAFYFAPEVARVSNADLSTTARFDLVIITAGHRANPLNTTVQNTVYGLKDFKVDGLDEDGDGLVDSDFQTLLVGDLFDLTDNPFQKDINGDFVGQDPSTVTTFMDADGWRINLREPDGTYKGEKGFSSPVVTGGKLFFTTFVPPTAAETLQAAGTCDVAEGVGRFYAIDVLTGAALFADFDSNPSDLKTADRYRSQEGPPSEITRAATEAETAMLQQPGKGPTEGFQPGVKYDREWIFWYER